MIQEESGGSQHHVDAENTSGGKDGGTEGEKE